MAAGVSILEVDGLRITVSRKAIRHLYLRLREDGTILLTAPRSASEAQLRRFVQAKADWLRHHSASAAPYLPRYVTGEVFPLWGAPVTLVVESAAGAAQATQVGDRLVLQLPPGADAACAQAAVEAFYRAQLEAALPAVVSACETAMGLHATHWQLRAMTSRWGSCTPRTGHIRLNLHLAKFPPACLRYVVVHELAHLLVPGHGPPFYALVERYEPDWRQARLRLKEGAAVLPPVVLPAQLGEIL